MSDLDILFDQALKKPGASVVTASGKVVELPPKDEVTEVTPVTHVTKVTASKSEPKGEGGMPWDDANSRVISFFQIRMPEPLKLKIEWLAARHLAEGKGSQHKIALSALEREIDRMIAEIEVGTDE